MTVRILHGDCRAMLPTLPAASVQCCVTSPPYFGLRDYGVAGQIGLEPTPDEYVAEMVAVFSEVKRVLRDDGCVFLNLGDSYASSGGVSQPHRNTNGGFGGSDGQRTQGYALAGGGFARPDTTGRGIKPKDLIGIPWLVAFALRADGWYLRSDCIWHKPNPMPESVTDRPTKSHEYVFLLTKSARYFWDAEAVGEPAEQPAGVPKLTAQHKRAVLQDTASSTLGSNQGAATRNLRSVWTIATQPFSGSHFATMPPDLAERCIKASSSERGCCPSCGAPWERVLGKPDFSQQPKRATSKDGHLRNGDRTSAGQAWQDWRNANPDKMLGWKPTCQCADHTPVPCTVLDPFSGAGTTALVADRLNRNAIGIELNPSYAAMGADRVRDDAPLFAEVT
jgi:DNA modification methylase